MTAKLKTFAMKDLPVFRWNVYVSKGHLEWKVTGSLFTELLPSSSYRMGRLWKDFFSKCFAFIREKI